ncbi:hypothetical protein pb186bvf_001242 [Paramecium bursaria]
MNLMPGKEFKKILIINNAFNSILGRLFFSYLKDVSYKKSIDILQRDILYSFIYQTNLEIKKNNKMNYQIEESRLIQIQQILILKIQIISLEEVCFDKI